MKELNKIEKQEWQQELSEKAPFLASLPRRNAFTTPEGYFEEVNAEIIAKSIPSENPFSVPEGYFEKSKVTIIEKIAREENRKPAAKIISIKRLIITATAAAAVIAVLIIGSNYAEQPTEADLFADITAEEADLYLQAELELMDERILYEEFTDNDLEELETFTVSADISDDALENYILDNVEQELIEEEL